MGIYFVVADLIDKVKLATIEFIGESIPMDCGLGVSAKERTPLHIALNIRFTLVPLLVKAGVVPMLLFIVILTLCKADTIAVVILSKL